MLKSWDFSDKEANEARQQINRRKSSRMLEILEIDLEKRTALFLDHRNGEIACTLTTCECTDFNFAGLYPRKKFKPCQHIYRLATEMGLIALTDMGGKELRAFINNDDNLRSLHEDPTAWGNWNSLIHKAPRQISRQHRLYELLEDPEENDPEAGIVHGYTTSLMECSCPDFQERRLPCKHIYFLAVHRKLPVLVTISMYEKEKARFDAQFHPVWSIE